MYCEQWMLYMLLVLWSGRQIYLSPLTEDNLKRPGTQDLIPNTSANKIMELMPKAEALMKNEISKKRHS
ncbi:MAG: hypothetical protein BA861_03510 [Desulfobacterales bacterium S3730MH5]|nr:MAG: hypothetical protein BA861_03510 [Desulfobacterales bacterium S3730MH5]OEU84066.1 MAG: hypothetical protein BA865_12505 [Desulfobacterales bacterium S5133MH4]